MKCFNERFQVLYSEINKQDENFIENVKLNIDKIVDYNECNCCQNLPNKIRIVFYDKNNMATSMRISHDDDYKGNHICVVLYSEFCGLRKEDFNNYVFTELIFLDKTKEEIYDFVIKEIVNGKKFSLLR